MPLGSIIGAHWYDLTGGRGSSSGWDVELLFATGIDQAGDPNGQSAVGARASAAHQNLGLRVLVRVDYAQGQSVPPTGDDAARVEYVTYLQQICQDAAYQQNVFGYIIGNEFNLAVENRRLDWQAGQRLTPDWYARVFNGHGVEPADTGNAFSVVKAHQPNAWVLAGALAPWTAESDGDPAVRWNIDEPWLNYFHAVCRRVRSAADSLGRVPDGFAVHAYGRTGVPGSTAFHPDEPHRDIPFGIRGAQGGFRVYRDWRDIIDESGFDPALPNFVTETNTFTDAHSNGSYPNGWYLEALKELQAAGPRFHALCWFVDNDPSGGWTEDRLTNPTGYCLLANADFNFALASGQW